MYTRGLWITRGREAKYHKVSDVLWFEDITMKPFLFIYGENDDSVSGRTYGEGSRDYTVYKTEITQSLIYPALLTRAGYSIILSPVAQLAERTAVNR